MESNNRRLAVFGSRNISIEQAAKVIIEFVQEYNPTEIVTAAEPIGVCAIAKEVSQELCVPLKLHFLNRSKRAAGAWHHRSVAVLNDCDFCLFVHNGKSKGTANEIAVAEKLGVKYEYKKVSQ